MIRRLRAVPWILVLAAIRVMWEHWQRIDENDRAHATKILADSKGMPHRMSDRQRRDLVAIARSLDHIGFGRDLADAASPVRVPGLRSAKPARK